MCMCRIRTATLTDTGCPATARFHGTPFFEAIAAYTDDPRLVIEVFPDRIAGIPDCVKRLEALGLAR